MDMMTVPGEEIAYHAMRLHAVGRLAKQDRETLTRMADSLADREKELESMITDDLGQDVQTAYSELLEWISIVHEAVNKLLTNR